MKLLFSIFLLLPLLAKSQVFIDNVNLSDIGIFRIDTTIQDTIPVMILYTDTTSETYTFFSEDTTEIYTVVKREYPLWMNGYAFRNKDVYYTFLNDSKELLPENIIVWMAKSLK